MVRTYLSIDLDYWYSMDFFPRIFMERLFSLDVPRLVVREHHELCSHINSIDESLDKVVNIDYYSDLTEGSQFHGSGFCLNEGTWGNFIEERHCHHFHWIYPRSICVRGRCNSDGAMGYCNSDPNLNPFLIRDTLTLCGWEKVTKCKGARSFARFDLSSVVAFGICFSPCWSEERHRKILKKMLNDRLLLVPDRIF